MRLQKVSSNILRTVAVSQHSIIRNRTLQFIQNQATKYSVNAFNELQTSMIYNQRHSSSDSDGRKHGSHRQGFHDSSFHYMNYGYLSLWVGLSGILLGIDHSYNCGIIGVVGSDDANAIVLEGLTILQNRGYDSAGIATVPEDGKELYVTKYASRESTSDSIELVRKGSGKHVGHKTGIGHTRWATHGGKTDFNAHPHTDAKDRIALIHNGTINNSYDLKKELIAKGIKFKSETDTEVIAQLVGLNLDEGMTTKEALSRALGL